MTESEATPKKAAKAKKPKAAATHPKTADMVNAAISSLKERGGSSLQAIKKYISATYKVDADKLAPFIRKYLKSAVASGGLVQTKGHGASGSFRMAGSAAAAGAKKPAGAKKSKAAKPRVTAPKKAAKPKKSPAKEKKPKPKSPAKKAKKPAAAKKAKPVKVKMAPKKKPSKAASPKKKAAAKKGKK